MNAVVVAYKKRSTREDDQAAYKQRVKQTSSSVETVDGLTSGSSKYEQLIPLSMHVDILTVSGQDVSKDDPHHYH